MGRTRMAPWLSCKRRSRTTDVTWTNHRRHVSRSSCVTMMQASYLKDADHVTIIWWFDFARDR